MQKRIELLGGKMDIDSAIGKGTSVNIELPIS
jgi:signal transduction histidine kinase